MKEEETCRLPIIIHRRLRSITHISRNDWVSNVEVKYRVQGKDEQPVGGIMNVPQMRWS